MSLFRSLSLRRKVSSSAHPPDSPSSPSCECNTPRLRLPKWPTTGILTLNACDRTCRFCFAQAGTSNTASRKARARGSLAELVCHLNDYHIVAGRKAGRKVDMPELRLSLFVCDAHQHQDGGEVALGDSESAPEPPTRENKLGIVATMEETPESPQDSPIMPSSKRKMAYDTITEVVQETREARSAFSHVSVIFEIPHEWAEVIKEENHESQGQAE